MYIYDGKSKTCLGKADNVKNESWIWIVEDGTAYTYEQVKHKFDELFKIMIKRKAINAVIQETQNRDKFPLQSNDVFDGIGAIETDYDIEKSEIRLKNTYWFLNREDLADALERLEPREKEYIELSFVYGLNQDEIAKYFHVTQEYVYLFRYRILQKLRVMIGGSDGETKL